MKRKENTKEPCKKSMNWIVGVIFLCLLINASTLKAQSFEYKGIKYTVIDVDNKTVSTQAGSEHVHFGITSGQSGLSGTVIIPDTVFYQSDSYTVTEIGNYSFYYCNKIDSISLPNTLMKIKTQAFGKCRKLRTLNIPASVDEIQPWAFEDSSFSTVIFNKSHKNEWDYYKCLQFLSNDCNLWIYKSDYSKATSYFKGKNIFYSNQPYLFDNISRKIAAVKFNLVKNPYYTGIYDDLNLKVRGLSSDPWIIPNPNSQNRMFVWPYTTSIDLKWEENGEEVVVYQKIPEYIPEYGFDIKEGNVSFTFSNLWCNGDETARVVNLNMGDYITYMSHNYNGSEIKFDNLEPDKEYRFWFGVDFDIADSPYYPKLYEHNIVLTCKTKKIDFLTELTNLSPTSAIIDCDYSVVDANVINTYFNGGECTQTQHILTGLDPAKSYSIPYTVEISNGKQYTEYIEFFTPKLELVTLDTKCVSDKSAIVGASTNMSDLEFGGGFQWKKYDAPSSLKPNESYAAIYDGILEGKINNLQSSSYYNVRAFYKSESGNYYYGDWVTFDPSDFSYFEPTVHSYPAYNISSTEASLKGYVMGGTDAIISQGFEYWISDEDSEPMKRVCSIISDKNVIELESGQVMSVVIKNLKSASTYRYRAYAETDSSIKYGEEYEFTTDIDSKVNDIVQDEVSVICYYDLSGRKFQSPIKGINIVLMSNGKTKKLIY